MDHQKTSESEREYIRTRLDDGWDALVGTLKLLPEIDQALDSCLDDIPAAEHALFAMLPDLYAQDCDAREIADIKEAVGAVVCVWHGITVMKEHIEHVGWHANEACKLINKYRQADAQEWPQQTIEAIEMGDMLDGIHGLLDTVRVWADNVAKTTTDANVREHAERLAESVEDADGDLYADAGANMCALLDYLHSVPEKSPASDWRVVGGGNPA